MPTPLVLLIDDDDDSRESTAEYLEFVGFRVAGAASAAAALEAVAAEAPAVAILDLILPDTDGETLARTLRARPETAGTAIIIVSGRRLEDVRRGDDGLYAEVLRKPVDPGRLVEVLRRCLAARASS